MRYLLVLALLLALAVVVARRPSARWVLLLILGAMALYAILKITGVIEAIAPDRDGVY
jgi:hypothetical protein